MIDQASALRSRVKAHDGPSARLTGLMNTEKLAPQKGRCTTLAVFSGKGGVGKTNISIHLALQLARLNKRVILFDADLGLANVNILLGINPAFTILDVVEGRAALEDVVVNGPGNLRIVPAGAGVEKMANLDALSLKQLQRSLERLTGACDYLLCDTMAGISHHVKAFTGAADRQLIVLTPDPSSLADAYAAVKMVKNAGAPRVSVIANMVRHEREGAAVFQKLNLLCKRFLNYSPEFLGSLPYDSRVAESVRRQQTAELDRRNIPFVRCASRMAARLSGSRPVGPAGFVQSFLAFLKRN